ncbi:hypothetical protein RHEC894_PE00033 (plasmid) [Rhizobium sp. CIAT894]|nr:hypothetical protein RHEC894_PE00033 [Rhizobium sp. CIAT894]
MPALVRTPGRLGAREDRPVDCPRTTCRGSHAASQESLILRRPAGVSKDRAGAPAQSDASRNVGACPSRLRPRGLHTPRMGTLADGGPQ